MRLAITLLVFFFMTAAIGCATGGFTRNYTLNEITRAPKGSSMISWTSKDGVTRELIYVGRDDNRVTMMFRGYREGTGEDLFKKDFVFSVAENYSADNDLFALTLITVEGVEVRIWGLKNEQIIYAVTADPGDSGK